MSKKNMNIVVVGHLESGKTTTVGRVVYGFGSIDKAKLDGFDRWVEKRAVGGYKFGFVTEKLSYDAESSSSSRIQKWPYEMDSCKGHVVDVCEKIGDDELQLVLQGGCAFVCVSCHDKDVSNNSMTDVQDLIVLALNLEVPVIVGINKLDLAEPPYNESKFKEIKQNLLKFLSRCGRDPSQVLVVPFSAVHGDNFFEKGQNMSWFDGPTVVEAINSLPVAQLPRNDGSKGSIADAGKNEEEEDIGQRQPDSKTPRLISLEEIGGQVISFLENSGQNADLVFFSRASLECPILLSGKDADNRTKRFLDDNSSLKVVKAYADKVTAKDLQKLVEEAYISAPSIVLLSGLDDASTELVATLKMPAAKGKLVLLLGTATDVKNVDESVRSAFECLEIKE